MQDRNSLVLFVVGAGTLLGALGASSVTLALPSMGQEFGVSLAASSWVMLSFLLVTTVFLLPSGRLGDTWGHSRVYLAGFGLFGLASLLCGVAPSFWLLLAGRALQGIGGGMIQATAPALLTLSFPPNQRGKALGIASTCTYVGLTMGPPLSGLIIGAFDWRGIFLLNVPIAVVILALGFRFLPKIPAQRVNQTDWLGTATLFLGLPLLVFALDRGGRLQWPPWTLGTLAAGLVLLALFVFVELRQRNPMLDPRMFKVRVFTGAAISAVCNYVSLFVPIVLLPFLMEEGRNLSPSHAGMLLSIQPLVMALVTSPAGALSDRFGTRVFSVGGMLILATGVIGLSTLGPDSPFWLAGVWLAVAGLGTGVFISPNSSALMGGARRTRQGTAGAILGLSRSFGMIVGVTLASSVYLAAGGRTGQTWTSGDFRAFSVATLTAAGVAILGAVAAALRGGLPASK